jgi:hypothetical protein
VTQQLAAQATPICQIELCNAAVLGNSLFAVDKQRAGFGLTDVALIAKQVGTTLRYEKGKRCASPSIFMAG